MVHFDHIQPSSNPSKIHPISYPPNCILSLLHLLKIPSNEFSLLPEWILRSVGSALESTVTPLKKTDSPSPSSYQIPAAPQVGGASCPLASLYAEIFFWVAHAQALRVLSQSIYTRISNYLCLRYCVFISSLELSLISPNVSFLSPSPCVHSWIEAECLQAGVWMPVHSEPLSSLLSSSICHTWW